jgi:hypothetical protein
MIKAAATTLLLPSYGLKGSVTCKEGLEKQLHHQFCTCSLSMMQADAVCCFDVVQEAVISQLLGCPSGTKASIAGPLRSASPGCDCSMQCQAVVAVKLSDS